MKLSYKELFKEALNTYGLEAQKLVAIEEMSELIKELVKESRGRQNRTEIVDEVADVQIMLFQLMEAYNIHEEVSDRMLVKCKRLEDRLRGN